MIFARQLAKSRTNILGVRFARHSEKLVIILFAGCSHLWLQRIHAKWHHALNWCFIASRTQHHHSNCRGTIYRAPLCFVNGLRYWVNSAASSRPRRHTRRQSRRQVCLPVARRRTLPRPLQRLLPHRQPRRLALASSCTFLRLSCAALAPRFPWPSEAAPIP